MKTVKTLIPFEKAAHKQFILTKNTFVKIKARLKQEVKVLLVVNLLRIHLIYCL